MEDCLVDRLWTDLEASKKLVDNINTLFQSTTVAHEDEGEETMTGSKSSGTMAIQSNKPFTPASEGETSTTVTTKTDPASLLPLENVKVEQRLGTY